MTPDKRYVRQVLDYLGDIKDALDDALSAMALEDINAAKHCLKDINTKAAQAIELLTPKEETRDGA
jgi:hypothetical protein